MIVSIGSVRGPTIDVVERFSDRFQGVAMAAGRNIALMAEQVRRFRPELVSVATSELACGLKNSLGNQDVAVLHSADGVGAVATHPDAQLVMFAFVRSRGLVPTSPSLR